MSDQPIKPGELVKHRMNQEELMRKSVEERERFMQPHMRHWNELASDMERMGEYEASRGNYDGVYVRRAEEYRRLVVSLYLEAQTGKAHCIDHLLPVDHERRHIK